jgi:hypothetical protein
MGAALRRAGAVLRVVQFSPRTKNLTGHTRDRGENHGLRLRIGGTVEMADIRLMLATILKTQRAHAQMIRDLDAQVHAIYDFLEERDKQFAEKFSNLTAVVQGDISLQIGGALMVEELEQAIRALEGGEPLNL